ncbi:MAG: helix-turn-helix transcriptional regulator [Ruminococcaceae bacterium]|nr:helix-turn-helix transcriptional regulator [Oscillospiraceae bacterium]
MTFGEKLAALRRQHNHTQEQLAELLGVSRQSVSRWESNATYPETEKLLRIGELYGCSLDELFGTVKKEASEEALSGLGDAAAAREVDRPSVGLRGLRISGAICFWLILAAEILRATAVDFDVALVVRMILLSAASILLIPWLIRGSSGVLVALSATVLALSVTQLIWGFFTDCYLLEYSVKKVHSMGEFEFGGVYFYTAKRFHLGYVLPYFLETLACALWFVFGLWTVSPAKRRLCERLWFLPACVEAVSLLCGVLMELAVDVKDNWGGGFRYYSEISVAECALFLAVLLLTCLESARRWKPRA